MFFAHAQDDSALVENSVQAFLALKMAGVPSELYVDDAEGHGYGLRPVPTLPITTWPFRCAEWMQRRGLLTPHKCESLIFASPMTLVQRHGEFLPPED